MSEATILQGDCRAVLKTLEPESIHCAVTSPPYFGLRAYGTNRQVWGGDPECQHDWNAHRYYREGGNSTGSSLAFSEPGPENAQRLKETRWRENVTCLQCGAWHGELGAEPTPAAYIANLVDVFRELWRVMRPDATAWLVLGDSYAGSWGNQGRKEGRGTQRPINGPMIQNLEPYPQRQSNTGSIPAGSALKPKDLMMMPHRVAMALQEDGWWVRADVVWAKPNPMPESVEDRPTKSHEYVFLLARSETYYYDGDAIAEPAAYGPDRAGTKGVGEWNKLPQETTNGRGASTLHGYKPTRNKRSVWTAQTTPYSGAHFATFPESLIEPCILAGTSEAGCCSECGTPWHRVTERIPMVINRSDRREKMGELGRTQSSGTMVSAPSFHTIGWEPGCRHAAAPVPCTVLDPFAGSGTVGRVAIKHRRDAVLIELNPAYVALAEKRINGVQVTLPLDGESA